MNETDKVVSLLYYSVTRYSFASLMQSYQLQCYEHLGLNLNIMVLSSSLKIMMPLHLA